MREQRTIKIDLDVHKLLEANRESLDEDRLTILRRLLGLDDPDPVAQRVPVNADSDVGWLYDGVFLPDGTRCRMRYNGQDGAAEIRNGRWWVGGEPFRTPTGAARAVAITKEGQRPQMNGWSYWEVRLPDTGRWIRISELRGQATAS